VARSSTTFPRKWNSTETTVIRVPKGIATELLKIARRLDISGKFGFEKSGRADFGIYPVAEGQFTAQQNPSMSQVFRNAVRFRYPGGKSGSFRTSASGYRVNENALAIDRTICGWRDH